MVFEYLISPRKAEKRPWELFFLGLAIPSIALLLSLWVFQSYVSLNMIALTTIAVIPLIYNTIRLEEKKDLRLQHERSRLREHSKVLSFYIFFFLGSVVAFALWYVYIPEQFVGNVFGLQRDTIQQFDKQLLGESVGNAISPEAYMGTILLNNLKILAFCLVFSLFFGAGAIYLLTLNASIIGTAVGMFVQENIYGIATGLSLGLFRYLLHGVFEIAAYFLAGLAGGIISVAVVRHDFSGKKFKIILQDSFDLILFAALFLFLGALVEVTVTPLFY